MREFEQKLRGEWPAGLTVLGGDDAYHRDRAQKALLQALAGSEPSEFGLTVYGEEKVDVATVVAAARSIGMFSPRRVVYVQDAGLLEGDPEALVAYAKSPPARSHLIVRAPALDLRRKLHQSLAKAGAFFKFEGGDPRHNQEEIRQMAAERDLGIEPASVDFLLELTGGDLYRAANELDKIRAWIGGAGTVATGIVREVAAAGGLLSGWEVADAVTRRDRTEGLAAVRSLVGAGEEPIRVIGGIAWRARILLRGRALADRGKRPDQIVRELRAFYFKDALMEGIRRYRTAELLAFPAVLLGADRTLKSRSIQPSAVLEDLVDRLTGPA
jgi:DNA polymerase-3 subunit delta